MEHLFLYLIFVVAFLAVQSAEDSFKDVIQKRKNHQLMDVSQSKLSYLAEMGDLYHFNEVLEKILIPRVVGTETHEEVKDYIIAKLRELNWSVETDEFYDDTPIFKDLKFTNIVGKLNPKAERFLMLACHYDSKYFKNEKFLGATDSAVPCAMLINIAKVMSDYFTKMKSKEDVSIMLVFFDGEEAFNQWTATDSIYGSRHLAEKWEDEKFLHRIDLMVLLDLLGSPDPTFYSFFKETENWYARMASTEEKLDNQNLLERYQSSGTTIRQPTRYFQSNSLRTVIEDDHIPFLNRGVPILHLIPVPFPEVWHKMNDNIDAIDVTTVENINKILRIFIAEYLHIDVSQPFHDE
ncbi:CLUMA_CG006964, isoform A [Clunio marinus]|uniref:Glutaminyl-peptide cyclotransferase n=1 Tax=Clunio marinus TaxID=568069 RepID=A0A1J1I1G2_9DIPT|nr:CLUMA_CG006964, isoform A [Clunio marinus]